MSINPVHVSIIVPVYNSERDIQDCLAALIASARPDCEIIVVDDASTDDTVSVAKSMGVTTLRLAKNSGPSFARNLGARHARGEILFFVDADVVIMPGAIDRVVTLLDEDKGLAAVFGSYDNQPRARTLVSQYRNLLHHYMHQKGKPAASTFWGACGAIRRTVFEEVGGFDVERFPRYIEDVELGDRVREAGHRILLDKDLQGKHLKKWTLRSMIRTDVAGRAVPWSRLIIERRRTPNDLNLRMGQRASALLIAVALLGLLAAPFYPAVLAVSAAALLVMVVLNRDLYGFFFRQRGLLFALTTIPLQVLYYVYCGLTYLYVWSGIRLRGAFAPAPLRSEKAVSGTSRVRSRGVTDRPVGA